MQIGDSFSFPKLPSERRLFLLIIEMIALKDKLYPPKTNKTVIEFVPKLKFQSTSEVPNILIINMSWMFIGIHEKSQMQNL